MHGKAYTTHRANSALRHDEVLLKPTFFICNKPLAHILVSSLGPRLNSTSAGPRPNTSTFLCRLLYVDCSMSTALCRAMSTAQCPMSTAQRSMSTALFRDLPGHRRSEIKKSDQHARSQGGAIAPSHWMQGPLGRV